MRKLVAVGLPQTGKTTYLAALWHVTESEEIQGSLLLDHISEEAKHLNDIRNEWLTCQRVTRTIPGHEQPVIFWFRDENGVVGQVDFPDLSGEQFEKAWTRRNWPSAYDEALSTAQGLLLFVHPSSIKEPTSIVDMQKLAEAADNKEVEPDADGAILRDTEKSEEPTEAWDPLKAPTQVQLVELLQFVRERSGSALPIRLAVIVSAWDLVKKALAGKYAQSGAQGWLSDRLPYLNQFLRSNFEFVDVKFYGVSAQGGDLETDREALQHFDKASEKILIEGPDCKPHDISEPVRWCLRLR